ncbi:MAG TPA: efflux RND transporter periplasmic adaptor subunit [Bdellovibrionota bacterium]|nr:efflux RND transporter periplasmic adaptor subunit [Bdellovibrionota bacterium]
MTTARRQPKLRSDLQIQQLDPSHFQLNDSRTGATLRLDSTGYLVAEQFESGEWDIETVCIKLRDEHGLQIDRDQVLDFLQKSETLGFLEDPLSTLGLDEAEHKNTLSFMPGRAVEGLEQLKKIRSHATDSRLLVRVVNSKIGKFALATVILLVFPWKLHVGGNLLVEPSRRFFVRTFLLGTIDKVFVQEGDAVTIDQPLVRLHGGRTKEAYPLVRSPINGVVVSSDISRLIGQQVEPGNLIMEVSDLRKMMIRIYVSEKDVALIHEGDLIEFKVQAIPEETFTATLTRIAPMAETPKEDLPEPPERFFRVYADCDNAHPGLKPGMTGIGHIAIGWRTAGTILLRQITRYIRVNLVV